MSRHSARERARRVKARLYEKARSVYTLEELAEWAWEDYGVRVRSWDELEKLVMRDDVTIGDLVTLLLEADVELSEEDLGVTEEELLEALEGGGGER